MSVLYLPFVAIDFENFKKKIGVIVSRHMRCFESRHQYQMIAHDM